MRAEINGQLECNFAFAVSMNGCFSYNMNWDRDREVFEGLEVFFVSGHVIGTARIINPCVVIDG